MEYGSDFSVDLASLQETEDTVYQRLSTFRTMYFDSGRSALRHLLRSIGRSRAALPAYLCDSILDCFPDSEVILYPVDDRLEIASEALDAIPWDSIDVFYLLHYFGHLQPRRVLDYIEEKKKQFGFTVIEDTTHSVFTRSVTVGDYCVCSLRKWFPIPDGGVLYSGRPLPEEGYADLARQKSRRIVGMALKSLYLAGELDCKPAFRSILVETEQALDEQTDCRRISLVSELLLRCQSVGEMIRARRENHGEMTRLIGDLLPEPFSRTADETPFTYVISTQRRDALRRALIEKSVYCAVHWPCPERVTQDSSRRLSARLMSIPVDQRYNGADMAEIANMIRGYSDE